MFAVTLGFLFLCSCNYVVCQQSSITREIVSDISKSLATEFARRGVHTVVVLHCHDNCQDKIKPLSSHGLTSSCICDIKDVRNWQHAFAHRKARDIHNTTLLPSSDDSRHSKAGGVGVVVLEADQQYITLLNILRQKSFIKAVAVYGAFEGPGVHVAISAPHAAFDKVLFQSESIYREEFSRIYKQQIWGAVGGGSGAGSALSYTSNLRSALIELLTKYNIKSMLDSSCGGMVWMPLVLSKITESQPSFRYMGTDVVDWLIEKHAKQFANHSNWVFKTVDYAHEPLPSGYELVFSRDSLQHLPLEATWMLLNNVRNSGAKYLLVGSYVDARDPNHDIKVIVGQVVSCLLCAVC
jgi:hypothetical protein